MTDERKQELFPYFAFMYSQQMNPEKYGNSQSIDEWAELVQNNPEDVQKITDAATQLSDEDWDNLDKEYSNQQTEASNQQTQFAKKGAKLKKLQEYKKGGKKCSCGCDLVMVKEKGGKISNVCSCKCGGKMKPKHQDGGTMSNEGLSQVGSDKRLEKINKGAKVKPSLKKLPSKKK